MGGRQPGTLFNVDGTTVGFQRGSTGIAGGSYGGLGGSFLAGPNPVYGDSTDPNDVGSGGATDGPPAGSGGGLIRIVAQTLQLDGVIKADGGNGVCCSASGGSGGGIRVDVGTLRGAGVISANGGSGQSSNGAGGGGGRVAIYYQDATAFNFATQVSAFGGAKGSDGRAQNGQNGTVFTQQQTFIGWAPMEYNAPVMVAESRVTSMSHETTQLASLTALSIDFRPDFGPVRIPDFRELISKLQAEIPQSERSQRRVFSASDLETRNSKLETYSNRLSELLTPHASPLTDVDPIYTYDLNGNRVSMIDPTGLTTYTYDALNRLTSITNNKGITTSFTYDALGRRTSMTHGNGVVSSYSYDAASQLTRLAHQLGAVTINSFDYSYDRVGNRTSKTTRDGVHNYTYDTLNRLVEAINPLPINPLESFTYDAVGNRTNSNQNGASIFNTANQLTEDGTFRYSYDRNGNQIQKVNKITGEFTTFEYDAENKLARVVTPGKTVNYKYDGLGRRVEKEVVSVGTTVTRYIYDNEDILLELDGSNNITARYTHGPGIDEPLILEKGGASFFYHADGLGSITEITDSTGALKQQYAYSSFGKIESQLDPNFVQPYTFTAREFDPETGLHYYRARYYDAQAGRFLQEDPIGLFGGVNFYSMVANNPVNLVDPFGLQASNPCGVLGPPSKKCVGMARVLKGNPNTVGKEGAFPGVKVAADSAAVDPTQFFPGMSTPDAKAALTPFIGKISGRILGGPSFGGVADVIGGTSPIKGMNVRDALKRLNPGVLIIELVGAPKDLGVTEIELMIPLNLPCPTGTQERK